MNWIVKSFRKVNQDDLDADFACEHVKAGDSAHVNQERDSFGIVGQAVLCDACHEAAEEAEGEETDFCYDCGQEKKIKDVIYWRWYDFYAPQGDEPLCICDECKRKPKHINRIKRDREDQDAEDEYYSR